jgi:hypothetical protein
MYDHIENRGRQLQFLEGATIEANEHRPLTPGRAVQLPQVLTEAVHDELSRGSEYAGIAMGVAAPKELRQTFEKGRRGVRCGVTAKAPFSTVESKIKALKIDKRTFKQQ